MKRNMILTLAIGSLLVLTSCGNSYGDFELVDETAKEETFNQVKKLNEETEDIDAYEETYTITGTTGKGDEAEEIEASYVARAAIVDDRYESDIIAKNSKIGTFESYTRYVEDIKKYMTYSYLEFVIDADNDDSKEYAYNYYYECVELNFDINLIVNSEIFSNKYENLHFLNDIFYDESINLYTSNKGYFKVEIPDGDNLVATTVNPDGAPIEVDVILGTQMYNKSVEYKENLDTISTENYSEPTSRELVEFYASVMAFGIAGFGVFASLIV